MLFITISQFVGVNKSRLERDTLTAEKGDFMEKYAHCNAEFCL
jgi:hypothetical protein